jgi:hypothetical protein
MIKNLIKNHFVILFSIFILSFLIRLIFMNINNGYSVIPTSDSLSYHQSALNILENGFMEANLHTRPILLPSFLSFFYYLFSIENKFYLGRVVMVIVSSMSVVVFYYICKKNINNYKYSLFLSFIFCIYPPSIYYSAFILTENIAVFLFLLITFLFTQIFSNNSKHYFYLIMIGVLFGLLTLTRSAFLLLPFMLLFIVLIQGIFSNKLIALKKILIIIIAYLIILTPWTLRNYEKHEAFMPTTSRLGYMLFLSNNDYNSEIIQKGGYERTEKFNDILEKSKLLDVSKQSNFLINQSIDEILENKLLFTKTLVYRMINTLHYRPNPYKLYKSNNDLVMFLMWTPILFLSIFSLLRRPSKIELILLIFIFYTLFVHLPFWGFPRFRYPIDALFIYLAFTNFLYLKSYLIKDKPK